MSNSQVKQKETTKSSKHKSRILIPTLILGTVILAGAGVGVGMTVQRCHDKKETPLEQAQEYLTKNRLPLPHPEDSDKFNDWSTDVTNPDMLKYFDRNITTQHLVNAFVSIYYYYATEYILQLEKNAEMTEFSVDNVDNFKTKLSISLKVIEKNNKTITCGVDGWVKINQGKFECDYYEQSPLDNIRQKFQTNNGSLTAVGIEQRFVRLKYVWWSDIKYNQRYFELSNEDTVEVSSFVPQ